MNTEQDKVVEVDVIVNDVTVTKCEKQIWVVYRTRYEGSLATFPDDYDFLGFCESESEALELCKRIGERVYKDECDDECDDECESDDDGVYKYEIMNLQQLSLKK